MISEETPPRVHDAHPNELIAEAVREVQHREQWEGAVGVPCRCSGPALVACLWPHPKGWRLECFACDRLPEDLSVAEGRQALGMEVAA